MLLSFGSIVFLVSFLKFLALFFVLGSAFLPFEEAREVFTHLLDNLPNMTPTMRNFEQYLRNFWLPKLDKITCWDDTQPRTNNPAEAYHSKLQKSFEQ